jgi:hypothetical protein
MAINNLNRAAVHVMLAKAKLQKRLKRNEANLQRLGSNKKYNYASMLAPVQALIEKNRAGIQECEQVIADLKARQDQLFRMIHTYGIKHSEAPQRVYELMGNYQFPKAIVVGANDVVFERKKEAES